MKICHREYQHRCAAAWAACLAARDAASARQTCPNAQPGREPLHAAGDVRQPAPARELHPPRRAYAVSPLGEMPPHPATADPPPRPQIVHLRSEIRVTNLGTMLDVLV